MKLISYLQNNTTLSRRWITKLINAWEVFLNNDIVESYAQEIHVWDVITITWEKYIILKQDLDIATRSTKKILLFHKPLGYVVSKNDPHNKTIYEILPKKYHNWWYIGRLDKNSSGLLLLTNDSTLVHKYEHPKFNLQKEYIVQIDKILHSSDINKILEGIHEWWDILETIRIQRVERKSRGIYYNIILNQGKKRHIRRIFKALNVKVLTLQRVREGKFELGNLAIGKWKERSI